MEIRKRCKHAVGLTGHRKIRAWRECGCTWGVDLYIDGVRKWHNLGKDEQEARARAHTLRAQLIGGNPIRKTPGKGFSDIAESWYDQRAADPKSRPASLKQWRLRKEYAVAFLGDLPVTALTRDHLQAMVDGISDEHTPKVAAGVATFVRTVVNAAARMGVEGVPLLDFRDLIPPQETRGKTHTVTELKRIIEKMDEPLAGAAELALLTGLRRGEILGLHTDDVLPGGLDVRHSRGIDERLGPTKTRKSTRIVTLSARGREIVDHRAGEVGSGLLWDFTLNQATDAMRKAMKAAGVYRKGSGWHAFRDGHTALLNEAGVSLRDAAARLGHGEHYAQTMQYGWASEHVDAAPIDAAAGRHVVKQQHADASPDEE